jgi:hypothetical protein
MTDKELNEWEKEAKEAEQDIKRLYKMLLIAIVIGSILYIISKFLK